MSDAGASPGNAPRFLTDANFSYRIIAGLYRRHPELDLLTAQTAGIMRLPDPDLLAYAKEQNRILLTHDLTTMPRHFKDFIATLQPGEHTPGILFVDQELPIGGVIDDLLLVATCSTHEEWRGRLVYLPL